VDNILILWQWEKETCRVSLVSTKSNVSNNDPFFLYSQGLHHVPSVMKVSIIMLPPSFHF